MFISNTDRANVLSQALPYIQKYAGKTIVVKYGGSAMITPAIREAVISDLVLLKQTGINVVLVHGGGPEINQVLESMGKQPVFINGLRYTDAETVDVALMVLAGKTGKTLVDSIQRHGSKGIGLCGLDGGMIKAKKYEDGKHDYGYVGEITEVDVSAIKYTIDAGYIPVISTIAQAIDDDAYYNINADTAAAKIAVALGAQNLILLTDTRGVMADYHDEDTLIPMIKLGDIDSLIKEGIISGGMIPKVKCCADAINGGIAHTHIIDGRMMHSILIELLSDDGIGTMLVK